MQDARYVGEALREPGKFLERWRIHSAPYVGLMMLASLTSQASCKRGGAFGCIGIGQPSNEIAKHIRQQSTQRVIGAGLDRFRHR